MHLSEHATIIIDALIYHTADNRSVYHQCEIDKLLYVQIYYILNESREQAR